MTAPFSFFFSDFFCRRRPGPASPDAMRARVYKGPTSHFRVALWNPILVLAPPRNASPPPLPSHNTRYPPLFLSIISSIKPKKKREIKKEILTGRPTYRKKKAESQSTNGGKKEQVNLITESGRLSSLHLRSVSTLPHPSLCSHLQLFTLHTLFVTAADRNLHPFPFLEF